MSHVTGEVPDLAPLPWHFSQFSSLFIVISLVVPNTASSKVKFKVYSRSSPLTGPFLRLELPPKPPPKISPNPPKISPKSLKSKPPAPPPKPAPSKSAVPN